MNAAEPQGTLDKPAQDSPSPMPRWHVLRLIGLLILLALLVAGYWGSLEYLLGPGLLLDLGSINFPTPRLGLVWNAYTLWGTLSAVLLALMLPTDWVTRLAVLTERRPRLVIAGFALLSTVSAIALRVFVLESAPLTDDESAYRFAAETLRAGHLAIDAPPFAAFLERTFFVINDRVYTSYFLGWPALLAIGGLIGMEDVTSALFAGLSMIPFALILRRFCTAPLILAGLVVYAASLMAVVMGATLLTHAASTFFILCFIEASFVIRESVSVTANVRLGAWCALAFCVAFVLRPATALAVGLPFLLMLAYTVIARPQLAWRAAVGFVTVSFLGAALYLSVNNALYGGYFETGYSNYVEYVQAVGRGEIYSSDRFLLVLSNPDSAFRLFRAAIDRLSYDFFGWPLPFFLAAALAVIWNRRLWLFLLAAVMLVVLHLFILDFGIDSFGPVHLYEAGPLLLILCCAGAQAFVTASSSWQAGRIRASNVRLPDAGHFLRAAIALSLCAWMLYFPVRLHNLSVMAGDIKAPINAAESLEGRVAVFAPQSRTGIQAAIRPLRHFVFFMPANDIRFENRVLWFRDAGDAANARLVAELPGRRGYNLRWDASGKIFMLPLKSVDPQ